MLALLVASRAARPKFWPQASLWRPPQRSPKAGLTRFAPFGYHARLMSADVPFSVDVWRAVAARRIFEGRAPLSAFKRLGEGLADQQGECSYRLQFERDRFQTAIVRIEADAALPLICQRTLKRFLLPVRIEQTLGLLRSEAEEASLPPDVEPMLVPADGEVVLRDLVEDELILALPVVPVDPEGELEWSGDAEVEETEVEPKRENPFAALSALTMNKK